MKIKEYRKMIADTRRELSRKYGFRQSSDINFKVEEGYFFWMDFCTDVCLYVKPMYADDLWWEIWGTPENKESPLSLRGTGVFSLSLSGQVLATYEIKETTDRNEVASQFEQIFQDAITKISEFITDNPDANIFYPDESKMRHNPDRLLYLMALIHNGKDEEALAIIQEARNNEYSCVFHSYTFPYEMSLDSYDHITHFCNIKNSI